MPVRVRQVENIFDSDEIAKHLSEFWGVTAPNWQTPRHFWWMGSDEHGEVACYCGARVHDQDTLYLGPSFVFPEYRGDGLQRRMIESRLRFARRKGFKRIVSSTSPDNVVSGNNLISSGFRLTRPWLDEEGNYWERKVAA